MECMRRKKGGFSMSSQSKSRKGLVVGIIAAVVVLIAVLGLVLARCSGEQAGTNVTTAATTVAEEAERVDLYWNIDRKLYDGKSEAGMSSREPGEDGLFHARFFKDGEIVELRIADRKVVNSMDTQNLMGLEFDENGIVVEVTHIDELPVEKLAWQFYVKSVGGSMIKTNSSIGMDGMEIMLETNENTGIWDMTGISGDVGCVCEPVTMDRVMAVADETGNVTHVFIYERPNYMLTHEAECEHCKKTVTWYEWTKLDELPVNTGHYQLMNDISMRTQGNQMEDAKICIDLNGKRVDGKKNIRVYALFNPGTELAIMDTSEGQTGMLVGHGQSTQGVVVWPRYGRFYLYGGTLDASDVVTNYFGGAVEVPVGSYFYMMGGKIIGGTAIPRKTDKGTYTGGMGGAVLVSGKFVMNGGTIQDGRSKAVVSGWNADGTPKGYYMGHGGNLFVASTGYAEINGGVIKDGVADNCGGNVYVNGGGELLITGGIIQNGRCIGYNKNGGSVFLSARGKITQTGGHLIGGVTTNMGGVLYINGEYIMSGGSISGGMTRDFKTGKRKAEQHNDNVFLVNGVFKMYGGHIDGHFSAVDSKSDNNYCTVALARNAIIDGGEDCTMNLTLSQSAGTVKLIVDKLHDMARIGVTSTTGIFSEPTSEENLDNFFSCVEGADILYYDGRLAQGRLQCICGSNSANPANHLGECKENGAKKFVYAAWTSGSSMPAYTGNYFITRNMNVSGTAQVVTQDDGKDLVIRIDLNGKQITSKGTRWYSLFENKNYKDAEGNVNPDVEGEACYFTVSDSVGTGKVILPDRGSAGAQGVLIWGRYPDSVINIYGGYFDATELYSDKYAGVVITTAGELNMYGGHLNSGRSTNGGIVVVDETGTFNMYDGIIENGVAKSSGGNIYVAGNKNTKRFATMNMYGGIIRGGSVNKDGTATGDLGYGGNIAMGGTLNMYGGQILDGIALKGTSGGGLGGNVYVSYHANLYGGKISGGEATVGGNLGTNTDIAKLLLDGVQVLGGTAVNGGNIAVNVRGNQGVTIKGNTLVSGGTATSAGGNYYSSLFLENKTNMKALIDGATIENGTAKDGGNLYVYSGSDLTVKNATITGGKASNLGGHIVVAQNSKLTMSGTDLAGGTANNSGNIYIGGGCTVNLSNLTVSGGVSKTNVGGIFAGSKTNLTLDHVTLSGNTATGNGGNLYNEGATVTITGSTIENGKSTGSGKYGGNIVIGGKGTITMTDTVVRGGTTAGAAGSIYVGSGSTLNATKTTLTGGTAGTGGGNLYLEGGIATFTDSTIENGKAPNGQAGNIVATSGAKFTLNNTKVKNGTANASANLYVGANCVLNFTDTEFSGGVAKTYAGNIYLGSKSNTTMNRVTISGGTAGTHGGNLYSENGATVNITDSVITGGTATGNGGSIVAASSVNMTMTRTQLTGGKTNGNGGNLYITSSVKLIDCVVSGGSAQHGGNVAMDGSSTLNIQNTEITSGTATGNGGAMQMWGSAKLIMNGGKIANNKAATGNNISATGTNTFEINGGVIGGGFYTKGTSTIKLSGAPVIDKTQSTTNTPAFGLNLGGKALADISGMTGGKVYVCGIEGLFTSAVPEGHLAYFASDVAGVDVVYTTAGLSMGNITLPEQPEEPEKTDYCICGGKAKGMPGHTCTDVKWTAWTSTTTLPTTAGNYYLTANVTLSEQTVISQNVAIDLKGHNITFTVPIRKDGYRMLRAQDGAQVSITDSTSTVGTAKVIIPDYSAAADDVKTAMAAGNQGMLFWIWANSSITVYDGKFDGSAIQNTKAGPVVCIEATGTFQMYGGTLTGGKGSSGGSIYTCGNVNLYGGTISSGKATDRGGNIALRDSAVFVMHGGEVKGGNATYGGNISMEGTSNFTLKGGEVKGGVATSHGGNIQMWGKAITVDGGTISGGSAKYGGNVSSTAACTIDIKSGSVTGGTASLQGGNIYSKGGTNVKLINGTISNGTSTERGGNIYFENANDKLTVSGGTLKDGKGSEGGNVFMKGGADMDVTGGTISGGTSTGTGGSIYLYANSVLTITGGTISGGTGTQGGNIFNNTGLVIVEGGTIMDGKATYGANICNPANATLEVRGGVIGGGVFGNPKAIIKLSGTVQIDKTLSKVRQPDYSLYYNNTAIANIGTLNEGSRVCVLINDPAKNRITGVVPSGYENYFFSDATGNKATFTAAGLTVD